MKAKVVSVVDRYGSEVIEVNGHRIQYGGPDGYCYTHGSFKCVEKLTDEENEAVQRAE